MAQLVEQRIRNAQAVGSSPTSSSRASFQEAFIVENNKVPGTRSKSVILSAGRVLIYAVFRAFLIFEIEKNRARKI